MAFHPMGWQVELRLDGASTGRDRDKGTNVQINTVGKIAIGAGLVVGAGLLLAACGKSEQDPQSKVLDEFQRFDRNRDNQWTQDESTTFEIGRPYSTARRNTYRVGEMQFYEQQIVHQETTRSMQKAFAAARGSDAIVSLQELVQLGAGFDADKNGTLSRGERREFDKQYGPVSNTRTILDRVETGWYYVQDYPSGGSGGGTSPGDDYGNGGSGGGTSPGDDYGNGGSGGGTSPGDGGGYTPPSGGSGGGTAPGDGGSSGGSGGSSGNGNSTDNGNPSEDDF